MDAINKIINNPFMAIISRYAIIDYFMEIDEFEDVIKSVKGNKDFSHFKLLYEMIKFAKIYEIFRPQKITSDTHYFGTVNKMDVIYFTLFKFIDSELLFSFSHSVIQLLTCNLNTDFLRNKTTMKYTGMEC
jgi:hypothetical protein